MRYDRLYSLKRASSSSDWICGANRRSRTEHQDVVRGVRCGCERPGVEPRLSDPDHCLRQEEAARVITRPLLCQSKDLQRVWYKGFRLQGYHFRVGFIVDDKFGVSTVSFTSDNTVGPRIPKRTGTSGDATTVGEAPASRLLSRGAPDRNSNGSTPTRYGPV